MIPIPSPTSTEAQSLLAKAIRVAAILQGFTTRDKIAEADRLLLELSKDARELRIPVRSAGAEEDRRVRQAASESARAEALNARIRAEREDAA